MGFIRTLCSADLGFRYNHRDTEGTEGFFKKISMLGLSGLLKNPADYRRFAQINYPLFLMFLISFRNKKADK